LKHVLAVSAALFFAVPLGLDAQSLPSYARPVTPTPVPTAPSYATSEENIHGRIASFDGAYALQVRDERGFMDSVRMHPGTIINPIGLTLAPGMVVSILGYNAGNHFAANEIDTPYLLQSGVPYYRGRPWTYWGPAVSLSIYFGDPVWWHGDRFRAGAFHGRDYVAPRDHGGYYPHH